MVNILNLPTWIALQLFPTLYHFNGSSICTTFRNRIMLGKQKIDSFYCIQIVIIYLVLFCQRIHVHRDQDWSFPCLGHPVESGIHLSGSWAGLREISHVSLLITITIYLK